MNQYKLDTWDEDIDSYDEEWEFYTDESISQWQGVYEGFWECNYASANNTIRTIFEVISIQTNLDCQEGFQKHCYLSVNLNWIPKIYLTDS